MTYGSNESLYYPDEELDLNLRTETPSQKSFEKVNVPGVYYSVSKINESSNTTKREKPEMVDPLVFQFTVDFFSSFR